jgi:pimeloyl-ACP methyl ester carboxylesterase
VVADIARRDVFVSAGVVSSLQAGDGPSVVLLHGIPTGAELWRLVVGLLADRGYRAVAPDLPGYGATRIDPGGDSSLEGATDLLVEWLRLCDLAPVWLVGHDAGGAVAQLLAVRYPELLCRLTLTNSIADGHWPAPRARLGRAAARLHLVRLAATCRTIPNPYIRWAVRRAFADRSRYDEVDTNAVFWDSKFSHRNGRKAFERSLAHLSTVSTAEAAVGLPALSVPTQLVWGMADPFQRWDGPGCRLAELLPSASVTRLDRCGHFTPLECPERLVAAMIEWMKETGA